MGRGCSTVVERRPRNQEVVGSKSCQVIGFFILILHFPAFLHQWSVLIQVPQGGASLTVLCESNTKWMPSCSAWGKTGSITSVWVKIYILHP